VFTANPEDYTNRGAIITPLKDRIQSQILTHYPPTLELGMRITAQEIRSPKDQLDRVRVPELLRVLIERIALEARQSEFVDPKSGVSARLTISALESVISAAERRAIRSGEARTVARMSDLFAVVPAITGKIELVYEGEQEGPEKVAHHLLSITVRNVFQELFPVIVRSKGKSAAADPFTAIPCIAARWNRCQVSWTWCANGSPRWRRKNDRPGPSSSCTGWPNTAGSAVRNWRTPPASAICWAASSAARMPKRRTMRDAVPGRARSAWRVLFRVHAVWWRVPPLRRYFTRSTKDICTSPLPFTLIGPRGVQWTACMIRA
jgi:hypothetical protein